MRLPSPLAELMREPQQVCNLSRYGKVKSDYYAVTGVMSFSGIRTLGRLAFCVPD